MGRAMVI
jgi:hypothetical protein